MKKDQLLQLVEQSHFLLPEEKYKLFLLINQTNDMRRFHGLMGTLQKYEDGFTKEYTSYQKTCIQLYISGVKKKRQEISTRFQRTLSTIKQRLHTIDITIQENIQKEKEDPSSLIESL